MDDEELLGFLEQIKRLMSSDKMASVAQVKGNKITLVGSRLTRWRNGWRLFRNIEHLRMIGILEVEGITFTVNKERLDLEIEQHKRQLEARRQDQNKTVAELFIKGNNLMVRVKIGDKDFERKVQRLNYGSNIQALLAYGLANPGRMIKVDEVQAERMQSDSKLRDIADTLSKDKAKSLVPIIDVFFADISKHTVTIRPMASVGMHKAQTILKKYDKV